MLFEIFNDEKQRVCFIESMSVLKGYDKDILTSMYKSGHRFKLDNKTISLKAMLELK